MRSPYLRARKHARHDSIKLASPRFSLFSCLAAALYHATDSAFYSYSAILIFLLKVVLVNNTVNARVRYKGAVSAVAFLRGRRVVYGQCVITVANVEKEKKKCAIVFFFHNIAFCRFSMDTDSSLAFSSIH